ncbi:MAG: hypothetical protein ABSD53_16145 [Terriglobales bacterium]|jgi:hypothetical protein
MQDQQVGWDPIIIDHQMPWQSRFFLVYLLFGIGISLVRTASLARNLWLLRSLSSREKGGPDGPELSTKFLAAYDTCSAKVRSIERSVVLTFLLCVLTAADQTRAVLASVAVEKYTSFVFLSASAAEVLTVFVIGVLVCALLYALCDLFQGTLTRRRARWKALSEGTQISA